MPVTDASQHAWSPDYDYMRADICLWCYLANTGSILSADSFLGPGMKDEIAKATNLRSSWERDPSGSQLERLLLPDRSLAWIVEEERQSQWLLSFIRARIVCSISVIPPRLLGRNLVIALIDTWDVDLFQKSAAVSEMEQAWNQHKQGDYIFKWFKEVDTTSRCELAWDWMLEKRTGYTFGKAKISTYLDLVMFFDQLAIHDAEKKLDIDAIKKRWSQQKYRKNMKERKQCNFVLSNQVLTSLDKLTVKYGVSRSQIIETLIQYETARGAYLPEKVRSISWE